MNLLALAKAKRAMGDLTKVLPQLELERDGVVPAASHPLDGSNMRQIASGIARLNRVVSPHLLWNQYNRT
jgi:hypothetical protein